MVLSDISIQRPVLAIVVNALLVVFGIFAFSKLPVREYPAVDPPVVSISTTYEGASAEVIESQITQVMEGAVSGIEGIKTIRSTSREGTSNVRIEFLLTREIESAANDVRDRVSRASRNLPDEADAPVVAKVDSDSSPILWATLTSQQLSRLELTDYVRRVLVDQITAVPGVADVRISGQRIYAMRVWLDRNALAARNLTVQDIETALRRENAELPAGRIESTQREFTVRTDTRLSRAEQFSRIVISQRGSNFIRLGDVAKVELGTREDRGDYTINGRAAVGLGITKQATANTTEVAEGVKALLHRLGGGLPGDASVDISYDESIFIGESIYQVFHALTIALGLVVLVTWVFLRDLRATLIPAIAIPVSIIAAFSVLAALGYSINVLTLLALVLAIGLVVDDAIIVVENVSRRIELGEPPLLAAYRGAGQIGFAVIATTAVLIAVIFPLVLLQDTVGRFFKEFAVTLGASVAFSALVALTLTPMMCGQVLRAHHHGVVFRADRALLRRHDQPVFPPAQRRAGSACPDAGAVRRPVRGDMVPVHPDPAGIHAVGRPGQFPHHRDGAGRGQPGLYQARNRDHRAHAGALPRERGGRHGAGDPQSGLRRADRRQPGDGPGLAGAVGAALPVAIRHHGRPADQASERSGRPRRRLRQRRHRARQRAQSGSGRPGRQQLRGTGGLARSADRAAAR